MESTNGLAFLIVCAIIGVTVYLVKHLRDKRKSKGGSPSPRPPQDSTRER